MSPTHTEKVMWSQRPERWSREPERQGLPGSYEKLEEMRTRSSSGASGGRAALPASWFGTSSPKVVVTCYGSPRKRLYHLSNSQTSPPPWSPLWLPLKETTAPFTDPLYSLLSPLHHLFCDMVISVGIWILKSLRAGTKIYIPKYLINSHSKYLA